MTVDEDHPATNYTWLPPYGQSLMCQGEIYTLHLDVSNKLTHTYNLPRPALNLNIDPCQYGKTIVKIPDITVRTPLQDSIYSVLAY